MGLHPEHTGDVLYEGKKLNIKDVAAQIKNGFALVPEDRQSQGLIQTLDIGKNTAISSMKDYVKGLFLERKQRMRQLTSRSRISILKWRTRDFQSCRCPVETSRRL